VLNILLNLGRTAVTIKYILFLISSFFYDDGERGKREEGRKDRR